MKRFLSLIAAGLITCAAADSFAQFRDLGGQRLILDDGAGGVLTVSYSGPGNATFVFPPFPSTTVPLGSSPWQTLAWDDVNSEWDAMSNLTNDGTTITATTQISSTVPGGTAPFLITSSDLNVNLNADLLDGWHAADFQINTTFPITGGDLLVNTPNIGIGYDATLDLNGNDLSINTGNSNTWTADQLLPATATQGDNLIAATNMGTTFINAVRIGNGLTDAQVNNDLTIVGGSVNNSPVGNATPSTGSFTTLNANSTVNFSTLSPSLPVKTDASENLISAAIDLSSATEVVNTLPINRGGTNSNTALNNGRVMVSSGGQIVENAAGGANTLLHGDLSWGAVNLTNQVTGILPIANGGTGLSTAATNGQLLIGNGTGFTLNTLTGTANRLSVANAAGTITLNIDPAYVGQNTITTLGTVTTGTWQGTAVADGFVADNLTITGGTITNSPISGNTGSFTTLAASSTVTFSGLAANLPVKTGVGGVLTAAAINLASATEVTGALPENRGGTSETTYTTGDILFASAANTLDKRAIGTAGQVLTVSGGVPTWATPASSAMEYSPNTTLSSGGAIAITTAQLAANRMIGVENTGVGGEDLTLQNGSTVGQVILIYGVNGTVGDRDLQDGGNIQLNGSADYTIQDNDTIALVWNGTIWMEISRSNN